MSDKRTAEEGRFAGLALAEEELVARAWPGATTTTG